MCAVDPSLSCRSESPLPDEPPCDHRPLSLDLRRPAELAHESLRDQTVRRLGDLNPACLAGGLHAGRGVYRVTPHIEHEFSPSDDPTDQWPRVQADPEIQTSSAASPASVYERKHAEGKPSRRAGVVVAGAGDAGNPHPVVPDRPD